MAWFRKEKKPRESRAKRLEIPPDAWEKCEACGHTDIREKFLRNSNVCPSCDHHRRIRAHEYVRILLDEGTIDEIIGDAILVIFGAPVTLPPGIAAMGSMVSLQPHGAVFTLPIHVSLPFDADSPFQPSVKAMDVLADTMADFLDEVGVGSRAVVVGNSTGADVALALARRHPQRWSPRRA